VPSSGRGVASGVYNSFSFVGSSLGGILGGALIHISPSLPEFVGVALLLVWFWLGLPVPPEANS
jgi:MFS family permease